MNCRQVLALVFTHILLAGCALQTPVPVVNATPEPVAASIDPGMLLSGKIVTMNDAGEILAGARLWIRAGRIEAIFRAGELLSAGAARAQAIETGGVIYPGMIDLHNHPEYAIYPLMPIPRAYKDRYEWRFYDDAYNQRITFPNVVLAGADYYNLGLEIGRYGEYKAIAGGTTSLQGGRANLSYSTTECLVRNIENSKIGPRLATSRVDIGRDAIEWADLLKARNSGLLVVHVAEGPSSRMAGEYEAIKKSGLVGPELIAIHGVGLTEIQLKDMAAQGVKLVWSPLSNFLLYAKTANVAAAKRAGVSISLAPDWAPSGSKSILGELKVADLVNKHQLSGLFSDRELAEMVTRNPARAMGWTELAGQIAPGFVADLVVMDDRHADPYRNLIEAIEENVRLVAVRGEMLYGDQTLMASVRTTSDVELAATFGGKRAKVMAPNCPGSGMPVMSLAETSVRLQRGLSMDANFLLQQMKFRPDAEVKMAAELARCPGGAPNGALTMEDTKRFLSCRFKLPYEKTTLSPLVTNEDAEWMSRLMVNPNIPAYLRALPDYYRLP
ncbi:MAG: amidohydrolase family protein [Betaproteobacteria bacterium]|nr:amidohydrolase family protein [Betaproteobacteria bacterium]